MKKDLCNGLSNILTQAIEEMKATQGTDFSLETVNLAELERKTGISRAKLRKWKKDGFHICSYDSSSRKPHRLDGFTAILDNLLREGVHNSAVCFKRLCQEGYTGSQTTVKRYITAHKDLLPAKRQSAAPQGNRGRRFQTGPGEAYQMDWGFVNVQTNYGEKLRAACFALICHHCGQRYIEFFPNAKQENLFIGMIHGFQYMGIPEYILTDNMKSVVIKRDWSGQPIWQKDYEAFMNTIGFQTKLCKAYHPFTKGKVERLIRFVKENFLAGRSFWTITDLNREALEWCQEQNQTYRNEIGDTPEHLHDIACCQNVKAIPDTDSVFRYLCPERRISFDGFVSYEGRRFGVPISYTGQNVRVARNGMTLIIYAAQAPYQILTTHPVTWDRQDRFCKDQYLQEQPEEFPTMPVRTTIKQLSPPPSDVALSFDKFDFDKEDVHHE